MPRLTITFTRPIFNGVDVYVRRRLWGSIEHCYNGGAPFYYTSPSLNLRLGGEVRGPSLDDVKKTVRALIRKKATR